VPVNATGLCRRIAVMVQAIGGAAREPIAAEANEAHPESIAGILVTAAIRMAQGEDSRLDCRYAP